MKILASDLENHIKTTVRAVNDACWRLRQLGIQAQLPESITITVEVVKDFNSIERQTSSIEPEKSTVVNGTSTTVEPEKRSTVTDGGETTTTEVSPAGQNTHVSEGGADTEIETRQYEEVSSS